MWNSFLFQQVTATKKQANQKVLGEELVVFTIVFLTFANKLEPMALSPKHVDKSYIKTPL